MTDHAFLRAMHISDDAWCSDLVAREPQTDALIRQMEAEADTLRETAAFWAEQADRWRVEATWYRRSNRVATVLMWVAIGLLVRVVMR